MELAWFTERQVEAKEQKRELKAIFDVIDNRQSPCSTYLRATSMQEAVHLVVHTQGDYL
jgi:hypothetical protein